jgi:AcrR family transcriptional regulator
VPQNRVAISKQDKIEQILAAAEERLRAGGYDSLSVSGLARDLRLAPNSIYWYFGSKDELFVAAIERTLQDIAAKKPSTSTSPVHRLLWFTDQLAPVWALCGSLYELRDGSEVVAAFVTRLESLISTMLANALREQVPTRDLPRAADTLRCVIEGAYVRRLDRATRRRVLTYAFNRFTDGFGDG